MLLRIPNYNDTTPSAPSGATNIKWLLGSQIGTDSQGNPIYNLAGYVPNPIAEVGATFDGGSAVPSAGTKTRVQVDFAGTITAAVIYAGVGESTGSAQITVKKCGSASFPTTASIVASAPLVLSSQEKNTNTLMGWTTAIAAGDWIEFDLDSASGLTKVNAKLTVQRS